MNQQAYIQYDFKERGIMENEYHSPLPQELSPWYCYTKDTGHVILCVMEEDYIEEGDLKNFLVPCPVKSVLKGYKIKRDYAVVDWQYEPGIGLLDLNTSDIEF